MATASFITRDPVGGVDGTTTVANPYHYVDKDPLNKTDPLGLRPNDSSIAPPPSPDPQPRTEPDEPGCTDHYHSGRIGDYLYNRLKPPCGFRDAFYEPESIFGFHGNAVLDVGAVEGEHAVDRCSGKIWTQLGNLLLGFPGVSFAEVDRAYEEFDTPCRAHDYAYDLIRFASKHDGWWREYTAADLRRDRADADGELRNISTGVCNDTPFVAVDIWVKTTCWRLRDLMYNGLRILSAAEGIPR